VASFAVRLPSKQLTPESILMILDERGDAEEIALELRRKGHQVDVSEITSPLGE
jgi:hypothetical protein